MANKPVLTKEQFNAKIDEFNNLPMEERHAGIKFSLDCEHVRDLITESWDFAKKHGEGKGITSIEDILLGYFMSMGKTILQSMGAPEPIVDTLAHKLIDSSIVRGMFWHAFAEVAPEEDVALLTGNFDVYSEVSNG